MLGCRCVVTREGFLDGAAFKMSLKASGFEIGHEGGRATCKDSEECVNVTMWRPGEE